MRVTEEEQPCSQRHLLRTEQAHARALSPSASECRSSPPDPSPAAQRHLKPSPPARCWRSGGMVGDGADRGLPVPGTAHWGMGEGFAS